MTLLLLQLSPLVHEVPAVNRVLAHPCRTGTPIKPAEPFGLSARTPRWIHCSFKDGHLASVHRLQRRAKGENEL